MTTGSSTMEIKAAAPQLAEKLPDTAEKLPAELTVIRTATYATRSAGRYCLTSAGAIALGVVVMSVGVGIDAIRNGSAGAGVAIAFLVAAVATALRLRVRLLLTAVIVPPLLFAAGVFAVIYLSGESQGARQLALETATALALAAPVLFGGTALAALIALGRVIEHLVRRRR